MAKFEVFIPAQDQVGFDMTFRVDADNWMAALKTGMEKTGGQGPGANILCDIKEDNSIHVTDPASGRVFRIRELSEAEAASPVTVVPEPPEPVTELGSAPAMLLEDDEPGTDPGEPVAGGTLPSMPAVSAPAPAPTPPAAPPPRAAPPPKAAPPPAAPKVAPRQKPPMPTEAPDDTDPSLAAAPTDPIKPGRPVAPPPAPVPPSPPRAAPPKAAPPPAPVAPTPAAPRHVTDTAARKVDRIEATPEAPKQKIGRMVKKKTEAEIEEVLADLFERSPEIFEASDPRAAMSFVLDLAMEKIPSDSGSVYRADISGHELAFIAARGPKADELLRMQVKVPVGTGLAGVCVQEGVGIAISDAHRDPRFFQAISDKLGYETRSVVTVPIQAMGQVMGAVQLINRKQGSSFSEDDLAVLAYLAHEAAEYLQRTGEVTT